MDIVPDVPAESQITDSPRTPTPDPALPRTPPPARPVLFTTTMSATSIFGFAHDDLEGGRLAVEQALSVDLEAHDSLYMGPYYRNSPGSGQSLQLRHNSDPLFDERSDPPQERFSEPEFPEARLLLYVHHMESPRARQMLERVEGISFLTERAM